MQRKTLINADKLITQILDQSQVHLEWRSPLENALRQVDADYLQSLIDDSHWLPGLGRLLAAFQRDQQNCRYILFGESPYPRAQSANGIAFHDAAVDALWSDKGLSKAVNRATSLRNIVKTALLAEGLVESAADGKVTQTAIAQIDKTALVGTIGELFNNLHQRGFLLLNATPVLHATRKPTQEARYWHAFTDALLGEIVNHQPDRPTLVLWGKIAQQILAYPAASSYPTLVCEHPYNLSFINNRQIQDLFAELRLLQKSSA